MGSEANDVRLPIIEFSGESLKPGTEQWEVVKSQVRKALEEYGCFEAIFNKIPVEMRKSLLGAIEELFNLPLQSKLKNISKRPYHGYLGQYPHAPLFESMGFDDAHISDSVESITNTLWPQGNPNFSKTIQSYSEQLGELDQIIRRMVVESLGLEKYLDEHMNSTDYLLRVMEYKAPHTADLQVGAEPHTDKNILTILHQNQVLGLDVQTKDGAWIKVTPFPESFIVIVGESLSAWTNGRLHSAVHRVMVAGNEARYSAGLFSNPKAGYTIKAPEEVIDEEHPLLFKPFDHDQFLAFHGTEAGQKSPSALKEFCSV